MGFIEVTENSVTFQKSTEDFEWRLVYDNTTKEIVLLDKFDGITHTQKDVYMSASFKDMVNHIQTNSLNYNSILIDNYDHFHTEAMKDLVIPDDNLVIGMIESFSPDNWRLVHNGVDVIELVQASIKIKSGDSVYTSASLSDCITEIDNLGLNFPQRQNFE